MSAAPGRRSAAVLARGTRPARGERHSRHGAPTARPHLRSSSPAAGALEIDPSYANAHPDTLEANLRDALNATDKERAKVVSDLKSQNDALNKEVGALSSQLKGFNWKFS